MITILEKFDEFIKRGNKMPLYLTVVGIVILIILLVVFILKQLKRAIIVVIILAVVFIIFTATQGGFDKYSGAVDGIRSLVGQND